jgi:hypothetical protein
MMLADQGPPRGTLGDHIRDQQSAIGPAGFLAHASPHRALGGGLACTIAPLADPRRDGLRQANEVPLDELLERSLGPGRVDAADIGFDPATVTGKTSDPDDRAVTVRRSQPGTMPG